MAEVRTAHTADLDAATLAAARALVEGAFAGDFDEHDWDHALGGVHALAWDEGELIGHAAVVQRRLVHGGRALRTGYVEAVGVRRDRHRRGVGGALMEAVERVVRGAYELGALAATEAGAPLYARRGWRRWQGATWALTPAAEVVRTAASDSAIHVLAVTAEIDLAGELTCDWRAGDLW